MRPKILVTLLVIANAATAQAQELINVHFSSGYYDMTGAAVLGSPGDSWNGFNVMAPSYSMNYTTGSLIDSTGSSTTATLTMSGWEGGPGGGCPSVDNLAPNLFSSYIYTNYSPATSSSLSFSGLAAKRTYQLIFYTVNYPSLTGRDFTCTINGITETLQQNSYGTYTSNPVSPGVCSGNYLAFTATTDASGNLNISFASAASPTTEFDIAGLQIQEQPPVTLPIEVMGPANTSSTVTVAVPSGASATSLWMQVHGSSYANKMSVSINGGAFTSLSNSTSGLTIADPERSYGGIGSNYPVMEMTLALPSSGSGSPVSGTNTITFRFNGTDGNSDGFRVLQFNFLNASGASLLPSSAFVYDDPNAWTPPLNDPTDIAAGQTLYQSATLLQSSLSGAPTLTAHCADCHTLDGHDLKYFNYSNFSIEARAQFHGLNATQGQQIASYIRSLTFPNPGRPWNPPYQPAANIDTLPISSWAAGGGIESVLPEDADALSYLFPNGISANGNALNTSQNVNMRTLPTEFMLPDWNHWLPRVHPKDAAALNAAAVAAGETTFVNSTVNHYYNGEGTGSSAVIMSYLSSGLTSSIQNGTVSYLLNDWADKMMLYVEPIGTPTPPGGGWTPALSLQVYGLMQWKQVKMWDVMTTFGLEGSGQYFFGGTSSNPTLSAERATWPTGETFKVGPAAQFIPTTDNNFTTSLADYEYLDNAWYALQSVLNAGNRERSGNSPIDWAYIYNRLINDLQGASQNSQLPGGWPEMTRLVSLIAKGMQQNDGTSQLPPGNDYANIANGWAPRATGDISLLVHPGFTNLWNGVDSNTKRQVLNAITKVWFSKMQQYTPAQYYSATWDAASGPPSPTEVETGNLGGSLLDKIFGMIPYLRSAGVDNALLNNICDWGATVFPAPGNDWASLKVAINPDVTSGLVGRWTFDEGFGTNVVDWSDVGIYTGVMQGTTLPAWVTTGQPVGYGCLAFNSANATQVSVTNWPSLGLGGSMTLSAWIKFNSVPAPGASSMIVSTKNSSGDAAGYQFYYNPNDGTLDFSGVGSLLAIAPATIGDTSWHHVVVTVSGTAVQIYKDGAALTMSAGYNTCGSLVSSSNPLVIGSGLNGQLDDVRVYNRGLSATEISTLYNVDQ